MPRSDAVPDLPPGAPQREAGLDLHAIASHPSTTPWLRSYPDVPPRARSAPRGAMTRARAPTLARHAEHAPSPVVFVPRRERLRDGDTTRREPGACHSYPEHQAEGPISGQYLELAHDTYTEYLNLIARRMPPRRFGRDMLEGVALAASLSTPP